MKTTQTFAVRFMALPKMSDPLNAHIYARVTVSKKVIDISLKRTILCSLWDSKKKCLSGKTVELSNMPKNVRYEKRVLFFPEYNAKEYYSVILRWILYIIIATYSCYLLKHLMDNLTR